MITIRVSIQTRMRCIWPQILARWLVAIVAHIILWEAMSLLPATGRGQLASGKSIGMSRCSIELRGLTGLAYTERHKTR
jgi:hypothetical protein